MRAIEVFQLEKSYKKKQVLNGINLEVNTGEIFGLLGRNGAGKSTFIHTLTGITNKTAGNFKILGFSDKQIDQIKQKIGVMPDTSNLYQHMRAIDFLKYMGKIKDEKKKNQDYKDLLNQVGLFNVEKEKIKSFSFGMKKKISIAQALLGNPDLVFLDEPTSGLDPESGIEIQQLIKRLKQQGKTIFLTSHNLNEVEKICDRVAIMSEGKIVKVGTVRELKMATNESVIIHIRTKPILDKQTISTLINNSDSIRYLKQINDFAIFELDSEENVPYLIDLFRENNIKIYEIKIQEQTLEDVFMAV
ncbi:ABC transporter ATP-binding protein [Neobacillus sp. PS3-40]|uniref:ABC transporter ATP-binding protein n=1 Tax=Neobacillus sp. PS3-40 TaxID=3070679 RepID=UPI0027DFCCDD|nr:ABC transporter ATP-binding protein [Neobacillus sp. PS3-40]WML42620.1 ABC transporter ATP-binding protein [Neobacillus sp. PS3-40]